jgi:SAM-dependent methyltransferase
MMLRVLNKINLRIKKIVIKLALKNFLSDEYDRHLKSSNAEYNKTPNERVVEYGFVFKSLLDKKALSILDVGTGLSALPSLMETCGFKVTAVDNIVDYWKGGAFNRHYHVVNDDILNTNITDTYDVVTCISVLEHINDHNKAVETMFSLLKPGGKLLLTFPYNEDTYIDNVYKMPGASWGDHVDYIAQVFSRKEINQWLEDNGGIVVNQEYWKIYTGKYHVFGDSIYPPERAKVDENYQLTCLSIEKK